MALWVSKTMTFTEFNCLIPTYSITTNPELLHCTDCDVLRKKIDSNTIRLNVKLSTTLYLFSICTLGDSERSHRTRGKRRDNVYIIYLASLPFCHTT